MTLPELVRIQCDASDINKKRVISPLPSSSFAAISPCTSLSSEAAFAINASNATPAETNNNNFSDNDENKYGPSSCLLPLAFDVVPGCSSLSTNQSHNFNPYQLNVSRVPNHEQQSSPSSPTRTLSQYNSSLDVILENHSIKAFNQQLEHQCLAAAAENGTQRKYSLDTAYLNRCSYYNKYFDCYTFNKYSDSIKEKELSCRRFSAPTPIPSSSSSSSATKERPEINFLVDLSVPPLCSERKCSMWNNVGSSNSSINEEIPEKLPSTIIKPKVKPRTIRSIDMCFTPSLDKTDKMASFATNVKICHKCGCASSKL